MSKSISIKEGNTGKTFSGVKRIALSNVSGGGSSYWVPEDETKLTTKHINENGTYKASEEVDEQGHSKNLYGYSEVTVSGIGKTEFDASEGDRLGGMNLEDGEGYTHNEDGTVTATPKSIYVYRNPQKIEYHDGENIDFTGGVVRARTKKNHEWNGDSTHEGGSIPNSELKFVPNKADISAVSRESYTDNDGINAIKFTIEKQEFEFSGGGYAKATAEPFAFPVPFWIRHDANVPNVDAPAYLTMAGEAEIFLTRYNNKLYVALSSGSNYQRWGTFYFGVDYGGFWYWSEGSTTARISEVFIEAYQPSGNNISVHPNLIEYVPVSTKNPYNINSSGLTEIGGKQTIAVKWEYDGKELTTNYEIDVVEESNFEGGGGGEPFDPISGGGGGSSF